VGRGLCPSPEKFFDFGSQIGFWCNLGAFCTVHLPVTPNRPSRSFKVIYFGVTGKAVGD